MAAAISNQSFDNISYQAVYAPVPCSSLRIREQGGAGTTGWSLKRPQPNQSLADAPEDIFLPGEAFTFVTNAPGIKLAAGFALGYIKLIDVASAIFSLNAQ